MGIVARAKLIGIAVLIGVIAFALFPLMMSGVDNIDDENKGVVNLSEYTAMSEAYHFAPVALWVVIISFILLVIFVPGLLRRVMGRGRED